MDIDKDLDRMIGCEIEEWKARKHRVVFNPEGDFDGTEGTVVGGLYVDGQAIRRMSSGDSAWVSLVEARYVADRLGVSLMVA